MISCLLIEVTRNPQGLPLRRERRVAAEALQLGRDAGCAIHLPDHRVALQHAEVRRTERGALRIAAQGDEALKINGYLSPTATLQPDVTVEVGPYRIVVEAAPAGCDLALAVEHVATNDSASDRRELPVSLDALGFSKRKLGLTLAACILLVFLLLPVLRALPITSNALATVQDALPASLSGVWSPGPLAGGHALSGIKCSTCHTALFRPVADQTCTGCHREMGGHLSDAKLQQQVAGELRCTACHADHQGRERLQHGAPGNDRARCVSCHGDIKHRNAGSKLADARDFSSSHPNFHLTLPDGAGVRRVPIGALPQEQPGLKYSHKVHLDRSGVSTPGGDTVMQCRDCHKPDAAGEHFVPMTMRQSCQQSGCHRLDLAEPLDGRVPHGSVSAAMGRLREGYTSWLAESAENRAACGPATAGQDVVQHMHRCALELARKDAETSLFGGKGQCRECHEITPGGEADTPWQVAPVRVNPDWQPGARFSHTRHATMKCQDCHDKQNSQSSADISMPDISKCRSCHAGGKSVAGKLATACESCHRFHRRAAR
ncbi:MAG: cytochrome c3 family protein [Gallionella sp.]|nr:cytochrome c3 family protein [Gallionella sp.]MDD4946683.1 cytochrome c3 family protein [Gallionella sp.]